MAFCGKCGREVDESNLFCPKCGQPKNQRYVPPGARRSSGTKHSTVWTVVSILILAGVGYVVTDNWKSSSITVMVSTSLHITAEVDVYVYIDGDEAWRVEDAGPRNSWYKTSTYRYSMFDSSKTIEIKAVAVGGGLGTMTDSETIIVTDWSRHSIALLV